MKRITILLFAFVGLFAAKAQDFVEFTVSESTNPQYDIITSNDTLVKFDVIVPGMFETAIDTFMRVNVKEHAKMDSVGYPEMPIVSFLVAIPACDSVNLNIALLESIQYTGYNIYPTPELVPDTTAGGAIALIEEFSYNRTAYETDAMYPGYIGEAIDKGAIRDQDIVRIVLYPVQFNPVKNIIKAYSDFQVTLTFNSPSGTVSNNVGIFNEVVGNSLINYESNGLNASVNCGAGFDNAGSVYWITDLPNQKIDSACDYLIITHNEFYIDNAAKQAIDSLAAHRANFNGFDVALITTSVIGENITPVGLPIKEKIFKLIENTYNSKNANHTYDGKLAYVNLFGDAFFGNNPDDVCIPTHQEGYDVYFTQLTYDSIAGDYDPYPDIMIGRCSVDDTEQVQNVVHKILHYKPDTLSWRNNMLNVVGTGTNEIVISLHMLELDEIIEDQYDVKLSIPDTFEKPVPDWNTIPYIIDSIQSAYQQGVMFFNHFSHGAVSYWQSALNNYTKIPDTPNYNLPFVISVACNTGAFQAANNCLGEQFLCADSAMGAIGFIGGTEEVAWGTARIPTLFQKALLKNYAVISGEAFMEVKLADADFLWNDNYNLLGDPALNVLYESTDTIFPELVIKDFEIKFNPQYPNAGDTLFIKPVVRNMTSVSATNGFYVSCKATNKFEQDTIWIGNVLIDSVSGYTKDTASFQWNTGVDDYGVFEFVFEIDTSNCINEMNEDNNQECVQKPIYLYDSNVNFISGSSINSGPVTYDQDTNYAGDEIFFGRNIISSTGGTILSNNGKSYGFATIANLTNNNNYQYILKTTDSLFCFGTPSWTYPVPAPYGIISPHLVSDFNQNGYEEVVFVADRKDLQIRKVMCLNNDGTLRWDHALHFSNNTFPIICNINQETHIVLSNHENKVYYAKEGVSGLTISDSITISNCTYIYNNQFVADINQDGDIEMVLQCEVTDLFSSRDAVVVLNLETKEALMKKFNLGKDYFLYGISDINNDGNIEIIAREDESGLYILEHDLDSLIFISDQHIVSDFFTSGDFNDDGNNDIAVVINTDNQNYIKIYGATGNIIYTIPSFSDIENFWISDIDKDHEIELICSSTNKLYRVDVPNTGKTIGWPGQRGTVRNTGTFLQPAYCQLNDTVYWTDNILIPDTFEIPYGATVFIKPGTHVFATENAEFIVNGKLVAAGTEHHPIKITANISTAAPDYWGGITAQTNGVVNLEYCRIENADVGLFMYSRSPGTIQNNSFVNNRVGICAYANSPEIVGNYFNQNEIALACHASSTPKLVGGAFGTTPYYNGMIGNDTAIAIYNSLPAVKNGKNDIYNDTLGLYMIFIDDYPLTRLNVSNNYYGSSDTAVVIGHFAPAHKFTIAPLLDTAQTHFKQQTADPVEELLQQAFYQFEQKQYEPAAQLFRQFIAEHPSHSLSLYAIPGEYLCYWHGMMRWDTFIQHMDQLLQDSLINTGLEKYASEYKNLALRNNGDFAQAIQNYEEILSSPVSWYDSLYAAINLSHTLLESGSYKSSAIVSGLDRRLTAGEFSHIARTKELLFSRPKESQTPVAVDHCLRIERVYPNPARHSFNIDFYACNEGITSVDLYSVNGVKILSEIMQSNEGMNNFAFDLPDGEKHAIKAGVYIVKISAGKYEAARRIVIR